MRDWLDAIPNLGVPGVPGVPASISGQFAGTPANARGVPRVPEHNEEHREHRTEHDDDASTPLKYNVEHAEHQEHAQIRDGGLSGWRKAIARLDPCQPADGFTMRRWQTLYDDASWLLQAHGAFAAAHGWSAADLFGLWPDKPHWGGIADRLKRSRALVMDADRASWRCFGVAEQFNRGSYPHLQPFWSAKPDHST